MNRVEENNARSFVARNLLAVAFVVSLLVHLALFGGWRLGQRLHWWDHQATWLMDWHKKRTEVAKARVPLNPKAELPKVKEIPLVFMEVDPAVAVAEPPKDAKYYGPLNSVAANPDATVDTKVVKVDGQQTKIERMADVPKPKPPTLNESKAFPLQPTPPVETPKPPAPTEVAESKPPPAEKPGDLTMVKPTEPKPPNDRTADATVSDSNKPPSHRPRTIEEARAKNGLSLVGHKMKQDGGVKLRGSLTPDVKATPFGSYDYKFIKAVEQRWFDLLEEHNFPQRSGKVVLEFKLKYDGSITDLKLNGNEVGDMLGLLCERAIRDPSPFGRWPSDMRRAIPTDYREITFTFFYN